MSDVQKEFWYTSEACKRYDSREEAIEAAKRHAFRGQRDVEVFYNRKVAVAKFPLPDIQVVDLEVETPAPAAT